MDDNRILIVENLSKLYRLGSIGTGTFAGDLDRFWKMKILGHDDPYVKVGQTNERTNKTNGDFVWALKDIHFSLEKGEILGVIGNNGAGKSTLLKILSRITSPTTGSVRITGRMASLLEVGTGFHPELTGRENIFLNGAILGMTEKEIKHKFNDIVDFSGCELYIDTPTKRYSSGMKVRLGFAVAAFLDPEILIVDEVLAVGDAEFQKQAIGKMKDVSKEEGRTVLFVSHNMTSISQLCSAGIILKNGMIDFKGSDINEVIAKYQGNNYLDVLNSKSIYWHENIVEKCTIRVSSESDTLKFVINLSSKIELNQIRVGLYIYNLNENIVGSYVSQSSEKNILILGKCSTEIKIEFKDNVFASGEFLYKIWIKDIKNGLIINMIDFGKYQHVANLPYPKDGGIIRLRPQLIQK
jgi:lipopolysaccharide transport system ATP-binding protein